MNGINKSFIMLDGTEIIDRNIAELKKQFSEITIITNRADDFINYSQTCKIASDIIPEKGPLGGIYTALKLCKTDAILVMPCDMPFIQEEIISKLIEKFRTSNADVVCLKSKFGIEPLVGIYSTKIINKIEQCLLSQGSHSSWKFVKTQNSSYVNFEKDNFLININSPIDLIDAEIVLNTNKSSSNKIAE